MPTIVMMGPDTFKLLSDAPEGRLVEGTFDDYQREVDSGRVSEFQDPGPFRWSDPEARQPSGGGGGGGGYPVQDRPQGLSPHERMGPRMSPREAAAGPPPSYGGAQAMPSVPPQMDEYEAFRYGGGGAGGGYGGVGGGGVNPQDPTQPPRYNPSSAQPLPDVGPRSGTYGNQRSGSAWAPGPEDFIDTVVPPFNSGVPPVDVGPGVNPRTRGVNAPNSGRPGMTWEDKINMSRVSPYNQRRPYPYYSGR